MSEKGLHERARAQFKARRGELVPLEVPEWDATLYFYPAINHEEQAAVSRMVLETGRLDPDAVLVNLMMRCRNEDGSKVWAKADIANLKKHYDPAVLQRISDEMSERTIQVETGERRKKK